MIVVADTSPLAALSEVGLHTLLPQIFGGVTVPEAVWLELDAARTLPHRESLLREPWLGRVVVQNRDLVTALRQTLGAGEAEAIALALQVHADVLLIDERLGRHTAERFGLRVVGTVGVLVEAKKRKLIPSLRPLLDRLRDEAHFYLSEALHERILRDQGEPPTTS